MSHTFVARPSRFLKNKNWVFRWHETSAMVSEENWPAQGGLQQMNSHGFVSSHHGFSNEPHTAKRQKTGWRRKSHLMRHNITGRLRSESCHDWNSPNQPKCMSPNSDRGSLSSGANNSQRQPHIFLEFSTVVERRTVQGPGVTSWTTTTAEAGQVAGVPLLHLLQPQRGKWEWIPQKSSQARS